ncbi:MAG: TetR/AcrR family transcriptional regulator [Fibrobacteria bacterium]
MPRPRAFRESEIIEKALPVFWRAGYEGCSITDLTEATGLQRQSLYNAFQDKQGLFSAVLKRYRQGVEESLLPLRVPGAGLHALRMYLESVLAMQRTGGFGACLFVKTSLDPIARDAAIRDTVEAGGARVRAAFAQVINRCKKNGEVPANTDTAGHAAYLYAVLHGMSALIATGGTPKQAAAVLDKAFSGSPPPAPAKPNHKAPKRKAKERH